MGIILENKVPQNLKLANTIKSFTYLNKLIKKSLKDIHFIDEMKLILVTLVRNSITHLTLMDRVKSTDADIYV